MQPFLEQQRPAALGVGGADAVKGGAATVAVCTYTLPRWDDLTAAVGSVVQQLRPDDECVVVIDHNEELRARAEAWFDGEPSVRVVASTGPRGLSGARNTAIATARGEVEAFLDDVALAGSHAANVEVASAEPQPVPPLTDAIAGELHTPGASTIEALADHLGVPQGNLLKAFPIVTEQRGMPLPEAEQAPWRAFAEELGLLFQIVDDILDEDGYVREHGADGARRYADEAAERARARLAEIAADTSMLREIVDSLAVRTA